VEWSSELPWYYSWCHQYHQNSFLSIFPLSSGTEKIIEDTCTYISLISLPLLSSLTGNLMFVRCSNSGSDILATAHQNTLRQ
jgi:hypothetical protein